MPTVKRLVNYDSEQASNVMLAQRALEEEYAARENMETYDARDWWRPGEGASVHVGTDAYAATIVSVTRLSITVRRDIATRTDKNGLSESQTYTYTRRDPSYRTETFRLTKHGAFKSPHEDRLTHGRTHYMDPSF